MALLNRDAILKANDITMQTVNVPEWGGDVSIRTLTGTERDAFEASIVSGKKHDMTNIRAKLVARSVVDEKGVRLFTDDDVCAIGRKNAKALDRIFDAAQRMNGIRETEIQELEKNSGAVPDGCSTSD